MPGSPAIQPRPAAIRLDWVLTDDIDAVIVELGANDALRGITPTETRTALTAILETLKQRNLPVLLAGMLAPRNLGPDYAAGYDPIFPDLAKAYGAIYYPFFLDGVATQARSQPGRRAASQSGWRHRDRQRESHRQLRSFSPGLRRNRPFQFARIGLAYWCRDPTTFTLRAFVNTALGKSPM